MGILIGGFFFLFGLIFFLVGGGISLIGKLFSGTLSLSVQNLTPVIFGGIGLLFMIIGLIMVLRGRSKAKKMKALAEKIFAQGFPAEATITFVDKNYSLLVNNKPIYSIVEFKFRDSSGSEHVGRKNNVNSDLVIRLQLAVGSKVQIKYMPEDPNQNIMLLPDPSAPTQSAT